LQKKGGGGDSAAHNIPLTSNRVSNFKTKSSHDRLNNIELCLQEANRLEMGCTSQSNHAGTDICYQTASEMQKNLTKYATWNYRKVGFMT
jgi:hypothetical protein